MNSYTVETGYKNIVGSRKNVLITGFYCIISNLAPMIIGGMGSKVNCCVWLLY